MSQPSRNVFDAIARQAAAAGRCRWCGDKLPKHLRGCKLADKKSKAEAGS